MWRRHLFDGSPRATPIFVLYFYLFSALFVDFDEKRDEKKAEWKEKENLVDSFFGFVAGWWQSSECLHCRMNRFIFLKLIFFFVFFFINQREDKDRSGSRSSLRQRLNLVHLLRTSLFQVGITEFYRVLPSFFLWISSPARASQATDSSQSLHRNPQSIEINEKWVLFRAQSLNYRLLIAIGIDPGKETVFFSNEETSTHGNQIPVALILRPTTKLSIIHSDRNRYPMDFPPISSSKKTTSFKKNDQPIGTRFISIKTKNGPFFQPIQ